MSWYREYRPRTVAGLHLTSVKQHLQPLLQQGKLPQVLLFAGPKGTGKTSTARILAAILNEPQNAAVVDHVFFKAAKPKKLALVEPSSDVPLLENIFKGSSYVVQELDAASHRGIDDVRAIKERVHLPPQDGKMSVYILDEVHMLTNEAFNALLKLLEEPPAHVVFILATTELHKIPATVVSRAALIPFTKATPAEIGTAIAGILDQEKITYAPEALEVIAQYADGSFRDGVKLAEVLSNSYPSLTVEAVTTHLALSSSSQVKALVEAVLQKNPQQLVSIMAALRAQNVDQAFFLKSLCQFLHADLLKALGVEDGEAFTSPTISRFLLQEISQLSPQETGPISLLSLELKLLDLIFRSQGKSGKEGSGATKTTSAAPTKTPTPSTLSPAPAAESAVSVLENQVQLPPATLQPVTEELLSAMEPAEQSDSGLISDNLQKLSEGDTSKLLEQWDTFVELVKDKNSSIAALLKSAQPSTRSPGVAEIAVFYTFHKEQLQQPKFLAMLEECVQPVTGGRIRFEFVVKEPEKTEDNKDLSALAEDLLM